LERGVHTDCSRIRSRTLLVRCNKIVELLEEPFLELQVSCTQIWSDPFSLVSPFLQQFRLRKEDSHIALSRTRTWFRGSRMNVLLAFFFSLLRWLSITKTTEPQKDYKLSYFFLNNLQAASSLSSSSGVFRQRHIDKARCIFFRKIPWQDLPTIFLASSFVMLPPTLFLNVCRSC